ncbi:MAG: Cna B-type domain-containing protein, partial [Peptostreptococcaceae bacterium]|nr:Cna B-type domain-containing protein [Peptostreptococcaceae bacterium]
MKKRGKIQKLTSFFLVFLMTLGVFIPTQTVLAESKEVAVTITDFNITNAQGIIQPDGYYSNSLFRLNYKWDASSHENGLHEGDYFEIDLPDQFKFPSESSYCNFDINAPSGELMAKAVITPKEPGGGKIKVTFTSYVNDKFDISGDMHLTARWNQTTYPVNQEGEYEIAVGSFHPHITLKPYVPPQYENEILYKTSGQTLTQDDLVRWRIRINAKQATLHNVILQDTLEVEDPGSPEGIEYVDNQFVLAELVWEDGKFVEKNQQNVSNQIVLSADKRSFTYSMGDVDGKAYMLHYRSTYREGLKLKNTAKLSTTETGKITHSQFQNAESGGGGQGNLTSKIKIVKVDGDNQNINLANAKFRITRKATGAAFEVTTNAVGEAVTMQLIPGEYEVEEINAPEHYLLANTKYTVNVTSDEVAIKTITNEPEKINIKIQKKWVGSVGSEVTAVLKADGVNVAEHKLSAPDWEYTFTNLRKYDAQTGKEIKYHIEEKEVPAGYTVQYATDPTGVLTITNIQEKTEVKVTKAWEDKGDQDGKRPASVTIKLLADGKEVEGKTLTLSKANNWTGSFTDLDEYKAGKKIKYTIKEESVGNGYVSAITGSAAEGYKVTNTREPEKVEVEGSKTWNDKGDQDGKRPAEITINLLKNGTKINSVKVKEGD